MPAKVFDIETGNDYNGCKFGKKADIPIYAMTVNVFDEDRQNAPDAGPDGHIMKPVEIAALMTVLKEVLIKKKFFGGDSK